MSLRALLQVAQLRQTERENASKELLVDSFEAERGRLEASLSDKVSRRPLLLVEFWLFCFIPSVRLNRLCCLISTPQAAECNRLNERLAASQQQLADLQSLREVDALDMETRQVFLPPPLISCHLLCNFRSTTSDRKSQGLRFDWAKSGCEAIARPMLRRGCGTSLRLRSCRSSRRFRGRR